MRHATTTTNIKAEIWTHVHAEQDKNLWGKCKECVLKTRSKGEGKDKNYLQSRETQIDEEEKALSIGIQCLLYHLNESKLTKELSHDLVCAIKLN